MGIQSHVGGGPRHCGYRTRLRTDGALLGRSADIERLHRFHEDLGEAAEEFTVPQGQASREGIAEDVQTRLFTPFFSTKADGRGLGLTLVREILVHHDAPFALTSPKGGPTRFSFSLKRV